MSCTLPPGVPGPPGCGLNTIHASSRGPDPGPHPRTCTGGTWREQVCCRRHPGWVSPPSRDRHPEYPGAIVILGTDSTSLEQAPLPASEEGKEGEKPAERFLLRWEQQFHARALFGGLLREAQAGYQCLPSARRRGACLAGSPAALGEDPPALGFQFLMTSQAPSCPGSLLWKRKMSAKL